MDFNERFSFYEKLYFHELERKEKLIGRLNLPLAMLVGLTSFLGYMLNKAPTTEDGWPAVFFWSFYGIAVICIAVSAWEFKSAWGRREYDFILPTTENLENYRLKIQDYYKDEEDGENTHKQIFKETIYNYYITGTSRNATNNDKRGENLNQLSIYLVAAIVFSMLSFLPFYLHTQSERSTNEPAETATTTATTDEKH